jgi:DNA-binding transcriptional LysR family regulator
MRIDQIKNFIKTVDSLSITKAAEELFISQSVLSKQIRSMEQQLGIVLFARNKSGINLTPAGAVAYEHFAKVLQEYENAIHYIKDYQDHVGGVLNFAKLVGLRMPKCIQDSFDDFANFYPKASILRGSMDNDLMFKMLADGDFDIYLTWKHEVEDNPSFESLMVDAAESTLVVSVAHPLADTDHPDIEAFKDENWIAIIKEEYYKHSMATVQLLKDAGFEPNLIYANNLGGMVDLISDGVGVGILSKSHILHGASSLKFIDMPQLPKREMVLAFRKDNKNPLTGEYIQILNKHLVDDA